MNFSTKGLTIGFFAADVVLAALCIFLYMGQDRTAPIIALPETEVVYTPAMTEKKLLEGITAYDHEDGDVTDSLLIEKISETADGKVIVTYAAVDSANNVGEAARILEVGREKKEN